MRRAGHVARRARGRGGVAALAGLLALATGALAVAVAETRPGYGGMVRAGALSEPVHLDPALATSHAEQTLAALVFDTLYQVRGQDPSGALRVVPHLAAALPEVSEDGREARIALRSEVRFHDDSRVEAGDVVASLERAKKSPAGYLLAPVRRLERRGDEVVLHLSRATPELAAILAAPNLGITPGGRAPRPDRVVGSGPFKVAALARADRRVTLVANGQHFAGRPYLNRLVLSWFERGDDETEAYEIGASEVSQRGAVAYAGHAPKYRTDEATGPATILAYVGFGQRPENRAITGDRGFRAALSLALSRDSFRAVGTGERIAAALHPVAAAVGGPTPRRAETLARMREARARLDKAARQVPGLGAGTDGQRPGIELELIIDRTRLDDRKIAEKVLAALYGLGIKARIASLDAGGFADRVARGQCDLYIGQLPMPAAVPEYAMAAALALGDGAWVRERLAAGPLDMAAATRVFERDLPILPLFHRSLRVHHRSDLRGLVFDEASRLGFADLFYFGRPRLSK